MAEERFAALYAARFGLSPDHDEAVEPALARMLARRTHRSFADRPVPETLLDVLLAAALSASSKSDYQQASILRVRDPEKRERIAALIPTMPWIAAAPVFLVFLADARRLARIAALRGKPAPNDDLEAFFNATVDAALALQSFILAAESVGLGCCPISVIRNHLAEVAPLLELPPGVLPVAGLCVGWPARAGHISMRLPPSVTVHVDRYDDRALPEELDAYDRRRDARYSTPREKQRAPEKWGYADFYGWSEDKARHVAEREGAGFGAFVRRHGFGLT